jgi:hypothetical protein
MLPANPSEEAMNPHRFLPLIAIAFALSGLDALPARAVVPSATELMKELGISEADGQKAKGGEILDVSVAPSNPRELTAGLAFLVKGMTPTELVNLGRKGAFDRMDPNTLAVQLIEGEPGPASFAKFTLGSDAGKQVAAFENAKPGEDLNLSTAEIAGFQQLGSGAPQTEVEKQLRSMLLARLLAYRAKGLAGIAPYARSGGKATSPAGDLRSATESLKLLKKYVPAAYQMLLDYPKSKPPGTQEVYRWSRINAHGVPTLVLTHNVFVPDGDAWVVAQRQFYVSTGYNCEQAVAAFLPVKSGTAVFYSNRTSTDQVTGFGGGAKRSIGSEILGSQLESLFETVRSKAGASQ